MERLTLESWFTNLEQTPVNRSQQLPARYKRLHSIDGLNQTQQGQNDSTTENFTDNKRLFTCGNRRIETHQWH